MKLAMTVDALVSNTEIRETKSYLNSTASPSGTQHSYLSVLIIVTNVKHREQAKKMLINTTRRSFIKIPMSCMYFVKLSYM